MLSAQLAAMELNVRAGFVSEDALIYCPGATCANTARFATVKALLAEARSALSDSTSTRTYLETLKIALDKANNNLTFVQAAPGPYTFVTP